MPLFHEKGRSALLGCLLELLARVALLVLWTQTQLINRAFHGGWVLPLLGIIFLPITTLVYAVVFELANGVSGWAWLWIALAVLFDLGMHGSGASSNQKRWAGYRAGHA